MDIGGVDIHFTGDESVLREIMEKIELVWPGKIYEDVYDNRDVDLDHVLSEENIEEMFGIDRRDFFVYKNEEAWNVWNSIPEEDEEVFVEVNAFLNVIIDADVNEITFVMDSPDGEIFDILKDYLD